MRLVFLLTTVLSLLIPNSVQAQTNLVANPGFESEGLSWSIRLLGDVNLDGTVSFLDISPFIAVLSAGDYQFEADVNRDGVVDFLDISPFIGILSAGGFQAEADLNEDGIVSFLDISPFIQALAGN